MRAVRYGEGVVMMLIALAAFCGHGQAAPVQDQRTVEIGVFISNIYEINFTAGTYKASFWLWFKSNDEKYEPEKYIEIVGGRDIKIDAIATDRLSDGRFYRSAKYTATINQTWDVRWFPFDTQNLNLIIESSSDDASKFRFVPDAKSSRFDKNIALPGWTLRGMTVSESTSVYQSDFGYGDDGESAYSRFTATVTLDHAGRRLFSTAFLGFFVSDILTGVTLMVESFEVTRLAIPLLGRLNMVVGALFGAVGNKYIEDNSLPPMPTFSLPDLVQISAFSAIAVALCTVIGTETLVRLGYQSATVTAFARTSLGLYIVSQLGLGAYILESGRK